MEKANDIKEELLKQMDGDSIQAADVSETLSRSIIDKHKSQLRRRKWIAVIGWLITLLYIIALYNLKEYVLRHSIEDVLTKSEFWLLRYSDMAKNRNCFAKRT